MVFSVRMADRLIGTTRFADFNTGLPAAELGWTWLDQAEHGTGLNASIVPPAAARLRGWQLVRLQLKTAASNPRSQRAIEKLGAEREGCCATIGGWPTVGWMTPCCTASRPRLAAGPAAPGGRLTARAELRLAPSVRLSCAALRTAARIMRVPWLSCRRLTRRRILAMRSTGVPMSRSQEFVHGCRDILPLILGAIPFGIIFGTLAVGAGLSGWQTMGMSALVFAGSAQFIAITLITGGVGAAVVLLTTFVVNLRHALYSAALQPFVRHLPGRWRVPLAFWLTDEAFAVVQNRYARRCVAVQALVLLGAALTMYLNWQLSTLVGVAFGQAVPDIARWGLDFAMIATFIGIAVPMMRTRPQVASAVVAGGVALLTWELPYKLGLIAAALAGIVIGVWLERRAETLRDCRGRYEYLAADPRHAGNHLRDPLQLLRLA